MRTTAILVFLLLLLCSCATTGPISAPVLTGLAAALAAIDQLLAAGVIDPAQHAAITHGLQSLQQGVETANQGVTAVRQVVEAVKEAQAGMLTTETATTAAGGLTAAVLAAIRLRHSPGVRAILGGRSPTPTPPTPA
jgi:hypothetical protein